MADKTFKIRMNPGPYRRELGEYVWEAANGFEAEVDAATAANLLTYPSGEYRLGARPSPAAVKELAALMGVEPRNIVLPGEGEEPALPPAPERKLSDVVGGSWATQLSAHGISAPAQLAELDAAGIERLAGVSGASHDEVAAWVAQAKR